MFGKVRNAVETLKSTARALDPICIGGNEAAALFDAVSEGERVCGAMKALLARRIEETKVWRESGHRSAAHWVAEATGETVGAATRTLETARALEQLPATDAAFRAGQLSETQAAEIGDGGRRSRRRVRVVGDGGIDEPDGAARPMSGGARRRRGGRQGVGAAVARPAQSARVDRSGRRVSPDGQMTPDAGARFSLAWRAHVDRIFRDARRAGRREPRAAYAADALVALASEGPCKPVEVQLIANSTPIVRGHTEAGERCEITGVGPVPVTTARALLNDASVTVLTSDGGQITAVSSPKRTIPIKLRRALEARYPTCGVKGCANDQFLEMDHVVPLAQGGRTEIGNTWRICTHHHHLKTYLGWKVVGEPGNWDLVPPDDPDPPRAARLTCWESKSTNPSPVTRRTSS
jgi:Domain of unknown function (DUF222)